MVLLPSDTVISASCRKLFCKLVRSTFEKKLMVDVRKTYGGCPVSIPPCTTILLGDDSMLMCTSFSQEIRVSTQMDINRFKTDRTIAEFDRKVHKRGFVSQIFISASCTFFGKHYVCSNF